MRESSLNKAADVLGVLAEEGVYSPTNEELKLKGAFLTLSSQNPLLDPATLTLQDAERLLGKRFANRERPGFAAWLLNREENRQRLEYLFALALGAAEDILLSTDPKAQGARVSMVRTIAELAGKMPSKVAGPELDLKTAVKSIGSMDKVQLQAFIQKNGQTQAMQLTGQNEVVGPDIALDIDAKIE